MSGPVRITCPTRQSRPTRTRLTLEDGRTRVVDTSHAVGIQPTTRASCARASSSPLVVNKRVVGDAQVLLSISRRKLDDNQKAMAEGFAQLLSTQLSLSYLQQQTELAAQHGAPRACRRRSTPTSSSTRSTPSRPSPAWTRPRRVTMLREFATCTTAACSRTPKTSSRSRPKSSRPSATSCSRRRALARRTSSWRPTSSPGSKTSGSPPSSLQPIVENAVGHARRDDGSPLHITVRVYHASDSVIDLHRRRRRGHPG